MSDFCQQCSIALFDVDHRELAGLGYGPLEADMGFGALCEGCGPTTVDLEGACIADDCPRHAPVPRCNRRVNGRDGGVYLCDDEPGHGGTRCWSKLWRRP